MSTTLQTSDLPRDISANSTSKLSPQIHTTLSSALMQNAPSIPAIEKALTEALSSTGWTTQLRNYIQNVIRSGDATSYEDVLSRVLRAVAVDREEKTNGTGGGGGKNGESKAEGDLKIGEKVVVEGVGVIRKELEKVCTVVIDD